MTEPTPLLQLPRKEVTPWLPTSSRTLERPRCFRIGPPRVDLIVRPTSHETTGTTNHIKRSPDSELLDASTLGSRHCC